MPLATTLSVGLDFNQSGTADFGPQRFAGIAIVARSA